MQDVNLELYFSTDLREVEDTLPDLFARLNKEMLAAAWVAEDAPNRPTYCHIVATGRVNQVRHSLGNPAAVPDYEDAMVGDLLAETGRPDQIAEMRETLADPFKRAAHLVKVMSTNTVSLGDQEEIDNLYAAILRHKIPELRFVYAHVDWADEVEIKSLVMIATESLYAKLATNG